jgi:catechol 2,3-dioxygenase-like lactoylglutathione lyase family enzyme
MSTPHLPPNADLEHLRRQAKRLLRDALAANPHALARLARPEDAAEPPTLAEAQRAVARENGQPSWPELVAAVARPPSPPPPPAAPPGFARIDQIWLDCTDLAEAERFYHGILGLPKIDEVPGVMAFFAIGEVRLLLGRCAAMRPNSILYLSVPGAAGAIGTEFERLKALGVRVGDPPHCIARAWRGVDAWIAFFEDPFGNRLALKSDVPVAR